MCTVGNVCIGICLDRNKKTGLETNQLLSPCTNLAIPVHYTRFTCCKLRHLHMYIYNIYTCTSVCTAHVEILL